ncbi:hypothetical protein [Sporolactobacillus sp. CQH2019]|uniref:hypothetical protein n=1 Tax=Sporolactobacillus sp. CQH2019 TaxID=3023512 RepID=UPI003FCEEC11
MSNPLSQSFRLPSLPYSERGQIHIADVRKIITSIEILLIITGLIRPVPQHETGEGRFSENSVSYSFVFYHCGTGSVRCEL